MAESAYILFTNLSYVVIGQVRTHCSALLLEQAEHPFDRDAIQCKIGGFGPDPAWPVFDYFLTGDQLIVSTQDAQDGNLFIGQSGIPRPLSTGQILTIKDGPTLQLHAQNTEAPICRDDFRGLRDDRVILRVWSVLEARVRQHWTAPNMPTLRWVRVNP